MTAPTNVICAKPNNGIVWPPTFNGTSSACATAAAAAVAADAARPATIPVRHSCRAEVGRAFVD